MPKAGTGGCWLELPLSTKRFATEDHCTKDECRSPQVASRLMIPHCVAPRCATDTYSGCIPAKQPDRTYGAGLQPCSTGGLLDMAPCACDSGSHEGRRHIWGRCAGSRCKVELAPSYECICSCDSGPRHRHARPLRAGRRPPPRDPHMEAFLADSTSGPHGLPGVSVILRNHAWPPAINALSWGSDMSGGLPVVGRRSLPGS